MHNAVLTERMVLCTYWPSSVISDISAHARAMQCPVSYAFCLRACYAIPLTTRAYDALCLCACYAMSGTGAAYHDICLQCYHPAVLSDCAALPSGSTTLLSGAITIPSDSTKLVPVGQQY
eukprot:2584043-Rhodomonas_salina.4